MRTIAVLLLAIAPALAEPFTARISLDVDAPEVWSAQFSTCLANKLRAVPGVIVTGQRTDVYVGVILQEIRDRGQLLGFALSVLTTRAGAVPAHALAQGSDLTGLCTGVAADIEQRSVEPLREAWQARQDLTPDVFMATHHK
jgi:hypothetical protein